MYFVCKKLFLMFILYKQGIYVFRCKKVHHSVGLIWNKPSKFWAEFWKTSWHIAHPQLVYSFLVESCDGTCCTRRLENLFLASSWVRKLGVGKINIHSGRVCVIIIVIQKYTFTFQRVNIKNLTSRIKCTLLARNYFRCLFCTSRGFTFASGRKCNHSLGLIMTKSPLAHWWHNHSHYSPLFK